MIVDHDLEPNQEAIFGREIYRQIFKAPFGAISKTELDQVLLAALIHVGQIDPDAPIYETARKLQLTTTRAESLLHGYRLRAFTGELTLAQIAEHVYLAEFDRANNKLILNVESRFWREAFIHALKQKSYFTDSSFNRERLVVDLNHFLLFLAGEFQEHELIAAAKKLVKNNKSDQRKDIFLKIIGSSAQQLASKSLSTGIVAIGTSLSSLFLK